MIVDSTPASVTINTDTHLFKVRLRALKLRLVKIKLYH